MGLFECGFGLGWVCVGLGGFDHVYKGLVGLGGFVGLGWVSAGLLGVWWVWVGLGWVWGRFGWVWAGFGWV